MEMVAHRARVAQSLRDISVLERLVVLIVG